MDNTFNVITNLIIFIPLVIIGAIMPFITRKDLMFGVTVPRNEWNNDTFKKMRKNYTLLTIVVGIVLMAISIVGTIRLSEEESAILMQSALWSAIILYSIVYIIFWRKTKKYKEQQGWQSASQNIAVADTSTDYAPRVLSSAWFLVYIIIIAATFFSADRLYAAAPDMIPMRFDMQGNPLVMAEKSMKIVYQLVGTQILMAALFFGINITIRRAKKVIDPVNAKSSSAKNDKMKYHWSIFLFVTGLSLLLIFTQIIIAIFTTMPVWITLFAPLFIVLIILIYAIVLSVKTGQSGSRLKAEKREELGDGITRDDDSYWKLGSLYFNKEDPAVFVEKRFGIGWTMNWARWQSWLAMAVILAFVAGSLIISF